MLPAELPLSLARAVVPAPPAMAQENRRATDVHQSRTPHVMAPSAASNALASHTVHTKPLTTGHPMLMAAQDQTGNAAVVKAVAQGMSVTGPPLLIVDQKRK